jgi:cell fate (sporulation/competence/biofilm development) regulator YmcA (YheA/YmcA/DUF963 family)
MSEEIMELLKLKTLIEDSLVDLNELPAIDDYRRGRKEAYQTVLKLLERVENDVYREEEGDFNG